MLEDNITLRSQERAAPLRSLTFTLFLTTNLLAEESPLYVCVCRPRKKGFLFTEDMCELGPAIWEEHRDSLAEE